jgi:uncharacterized protein
MNGYEQITSDLAGAMRSRDTDSVRTLRSLLGAIGNAGAVTGGGDAAEQIGAFSTETPRRELSSEEIRGIVESEIGERREAVVLYKDAGRPDIIGQLEKEIQILSRYQSVD